MLCILQIIGYDNPQLEASDLIKAAGEGRGLDQGLGPLYTSVRMSWDAAGVIPTEVGGGLGEWDCGVICNLKDVPNLVEFMYRRHGAAFRSRLLRWYFHVCPPKITKPASKDSNGPQTT